MKISKWILCAVIFGALLGTGCEKLIENQIKKVVEKAGEAATDELTDKTNIGSKEVDEGDAEVTQALNIYTGCINRTSKSVLSSRARYLSWAKDDTTKLPKSRYRGLYSIKSQSDKCIKELGTLGDDAVLPALFVAGGRYKTTLAALIPVVEKAYLYYNEKDYKDDKGDKARKWHPMLVTGFRAFLVADKVMRRELAAITDVRRVAYLKKMEAEFGRTLPFLIAAVGQSATSIVRLADVPVKEVNVDDVEGTLEQYIALVAEMETYSAAHPEETKKYFAFSSVISAAVGLRKETKNFVRAHRGRSNRAKRKSAKKIVDAYNRWIDRSNSAKR